MATLRRILVPVDFSDSSRAALDYAAELARAFGATLDVLHVWQAPTFIPTANLPEAGVADASMVEFVKKNAEHALDQLLADAVQRGIKLHEARAEPGSPAHTIVELARQGAYDLIVIGTHGRTGLTRALIGSVAERVVRHAHCPVLSVRAAT